MKNKLLLLATCGLLLLSTFTPLCTFYAAELPEDPQISFETPEKTLSTDTEQLTVELVYTPDTLMSAQNEDRLKISLPPGLTYEASCNPGLEKLVAAAENELVISLDELTQKTRLHFSVKHDRLPKEAKITGEHQRNGETISRLKELVFTQETAESANTSETPSSESTTPSSATENAATTSSTAEATVPSAETPETPAPESGRSKRSLDAAPPTAEVRSWSALKNALLAQEPHITVAADLTAKERLPKISAKTMIDFDGHALNIKEKSFEVAPSGELTLANVVLSGSKNAYLFKGRGKALLTGTIGAAANNKTGLANMKEGSLAIENAAVTYDRGKSDEPAIIAKNLTITRSEVLSNAVKFYYTQENGSAVLINGASTVETNSNRHTFNGQVWQIEGTSAITITDHSRLSMNGNIKNDGNNGGLFVINAPGSTLNVFNHSVLESHSKHTCAVLLQSAGGAFNVDDGSRIDLISDGDYNSLTATLRFRFAGDMTFNITRASEINVLKTAGYAPAIRMYGGNNKINVSGSSNFVVRNYGDGVIRDPGRDGENQAIQYAAGNANEFNVKDADSSIDITADNGAAIDATHNSLKIRADEGTYFVARGKTAARTSGIFNAGMLDFKMTAPKYYDFCNYNFGKVFETNSPASTFVNQSSSLNVWYKGSDVTGDPSHVWNTLMDFTLAGYDLSHLWSTSDWQMAHEFGHMTNYSRMTANNMTALIDELRPPTDADKFIYAHVSIPEAKNKLRDAYTDEVKLKVGLFDENDQLLATLAGTTSGMPESIYGEPARAGIVKIAAPNNEFLTAGHKVKVLNAWRGVDGKQWDLPTPGADLAEALTVVDVTPPQDGRLKDDLTEISASATMIEGFGEAGSTVRLEKNGQATAVETIVSADGCFTLDLPQSLALKKDDHLQLRLQDTAGNLQPTADLPYHDAVFLAGKTFLVTEALPDPGTLRFDEVPANFEFGTTALSPKAQVVSARAASPAETQQIKVYDDRPGEAAWTVKARMTDFVSTKDPRKVLKDAQLVLPKGEFTDPLALNAPGEIHLSKEDQTIFSAKGKQAQKQTSYHWNKNKVQLELAANQGKAGESYHSEIIWTLESGVVK